LLKLSIECPHCQSRTFLDTVTEAQFAVSESALRSVLHAFKCSHCGNQFGTRGGRLHADSEA
jgi:DNA-directed RNA polymerase subunit RPC12/RpoP